MAATATLPQEQSKATTGTRRAKSKTANAPAAPPGPILEVAPTPQLTIAQAAKPSAIVEPAVSVAQAVEEWKRYQEICRNILEENDYIYYVRSSSTEGKENKPVACRTKKQADDLAARLTATAQKNIEVSPSKKRSAWDKLARFYNLSVPSDDSGALCAIAEAVTVGAFIVERLIGESFKIFIYQDASDLKIVKASVLLKVVAPNGRTVLGDGACAVSERRLGAESFAHADHDIFSTAFTRAFNRGVSRCIGTGEVSAEEFESAAPEPSSAITIPSAPVADISTSKSTATTAAAVGAPAVHHEERNAAPGVKAQSVEAPAKPPRAEIPSGNFETSKQASFPSEQPQPATKAEAVSSPSGFTPLGETASATDPGVMVAPSNKDRFCSVHDFLFGKNVRFADEPLVAFLIFSVAPLLAGPIVITRKGKLDVGTPRELGAFTKAMQRLGDLPARLTTIENVLVEKPKGQFILWAQALIASAKGRGVFGE